MKDSTFVKLLVAWGIVWATTIAVVAYVGIHFLLKVW